MVNVVLVVNDEEGKPEEFENLTSVEVRGPTGVATYRLDPLQDHTLKIVVNGEKAKKKATAEKA